MSGLPDSETSIKGKIGNRKIIQDCSLLHCRWPAPFTSPAQHMASWAPPEMISEHRASSKT